MHALSVIVLADGRYRATCCCGFKGFRTPKRPIAEAQAQQHLNYHAEVAAMTPAPARAQEGT